MSFEPIEEPQEPIKENPVAAQNEPLTLDIQEETVLGARIKVVGVGGGGCGCN